MSSEIIIGILSFMGTALGAFGGLQLTKYRISQLEKKVDKHNHLIERQYDLEKITAVLSEEIRVANHRLKDLEQYHKQ